ncbi:uncharacterized protein SPPG_02177 [Spizellomyces punctatus DAOM BR117]|uniref:PhoD-like phosphatase domain-containing protein n=1 Tax=Spizellomyces punctatus (strain DAOM BR117) TaxID=645134 RepID=A0A0L0HNY9_SPIPD|nr:uncharacterized protein SPPG_02177 [Spizellomyces punctatus DAOM BR117]KND03116.1 hypothetical protein SPPG_02177 [Spizellomyces punctatus DAOM BR117]|eukprot:XP_016611155.1 hypothetical protein SPPG_02177 [Spizellomyces punctatus DAOM BR117]
MNPEKPNPYPSGPPPAYSAQPSAAHTDVYPAYPVQSYPPPFVNSGYPPTTASGAYPPVSYGGAPYGGAPYPVTPYPTAAEAATGQSMPSKKGQSGQVFGPYLRYVNMDVGNRMWFGSILVLTSSPSPVTATVYSNLPGTSPLYVPSNVIDTHLQYTFHRIDLTLPMGDYPAMWTYSIDALSEQTFNFHVASVHDRNWRFAFYSCSGFSNSVSKEERERLGGVGALWKDVLSLHRENGKEFHVMLGGGDQIYGDPIWKELDGLKAWLQIKGKENRRNAPWTPELEFAVSSFYFNMYTSHFATPHLREALASIPSIFQIDDHDIFDGYGSYPEYLQHSQYFQNIGRIAWRFYLLFQQHTTMRLAALGGPHAREFISPNGQTFHFVKLLGPSVALFGPDTRSERTPMQILSPQSYNLLFQTLRTLPPTIKHVIAMLAVPIVYPRLKAPETLLTHFGKTKRSANNAVNEIGKGLGSVAGSAGRLLGKVGLKVDAQQWEAETKGTIDDVLGNVKKGLGKSGLMSGVISQFGEVDLLDDLIDHWTHPNHTPERTALITRLQAHASQTRTRISFISGDVHCAGVGRFFTPTNPTDPTLMYQFIASAIVNIPPPKGVLKMLHSSAKQLDFGNGVKEEMLDMFPKDVDGKTLKDQKLIGRRNWGVGCVVGDELHVVIRVEGTQTGVCVPFGPIVVPPVV